jgi:hypothetical protein
MPLFSHIQCKVVGLKLHGAMQVAKPTRASNRLRRSVVPTQENVLNELPKGEKTIAPAEEVERFDNPVLDRNSPPLDVPDGPLVQETSGTQLDDELSLDDLDGEL